MDVVLYSHNHLTINQPGVLRWPCMDTWHERRPYVQMFHPRYMHVRIHTNNSEVYILLLYMHIYIDAWDIYVSTDARSALSIFSHPCSEPRASLSRCPEPVPCPVLATAQQPALLVFSFSFPSSFLLFFFYSGQKTRMYRELRNSSGCLG